MGLQRTPGDAMGSRKGPYIDRAPIRDNQAMHRALSDPVASHNPESQGDHGDLGAVTAADVTKSGLNEIEPA